MDGITAVTTDGRLRHVYSAPGLPYLEDIAQNGDTLITMARPRMRLETGTRSGGLADARDLSWLDWTLLRDMTPDGSTVLFDETGAGAGEPAGIFLRPTDGSPAVRLSDGVCAAISSDGRWVLGSGVAGSKEALIVPVGAGQARHIAVGNLSISYGDWFPDGKEVVLNALDPAEGRGLYRLNLDTCEIQRIHPHGVGGSTVIVAPDGSGAIARTENLLHAFFPMDGSEPTIYPELDQVWKPCGWAEDSRHFFAHRSGAIPSTVLKIDARTGAQEVWMEVTPLIRSGVDGINSLRLSRDGERYACSYVSNDGTLCHARGLG